jgi:hypothetical protein
VAEIPGRAPRVEAFRTGDVRADSWTFETPAAGPGAPYDDPSPWGDFLRERVGAHPATASLSQPLRCAAQEIARFHRAQHASGAGGLPAESLRRFMVARCGGTEPMVTPAVWTVEAPRAVTDVALLEHVRSAIGKQIDAQLSSSAAGHQSVGLALTRDDRGASVVVLFAPDEARLEPGPRRVDGQRRITLRGAARGDFVELDAMINRGPLGFAQCDADPTVKAPRFAVTCTLAEGDAFDWVEILGRKKGLYLSHTVADVLVTAGDESAVQYVAHHYGEPTPVATPDAFRAAIVAGVNRVRASGHMAPVVLAPKQSAENTRLAGTLIDASLSSDDPTADRAAIGLLAGWGVEGLIQNGSLWLGAVAPTRDATAWLDFALERPLGRMALLDPAARRIAVGPAVPEGAEALGAVVTTYTLFESPDHAADTARFVERLAQARVARGLPAPVRVAAFDEMTEATARVFRGEESSREALDDMLAGAAARVGASVQGYVFETNDLERVEVPAALLEARPGAMHVAVAVTHHRAPGAAWGQYVVFLVLVGGEPLREARASFIHGG